MTAPGIPTTDLFMYRRKQNIKDFLILLCLIICLGFFKVYAYFHLNLSLRKENICVVLIISEQPSYTCNKAFNVKPKFYKPICL